MQINIFNLFWIIPLSSAFGMLITAVAPLERMTKNEINKH